MHEASQHTTKTCAQPKEPFSRFSGAVITSRKATINITRNKKDALQWRIKVEQQNSTSNDRIAYIEELIKILNTESENSTLIVTISSDSLVLIRKGISDALSELRGELTKRLIKRFKESDSGRAKALDPKNPESYNVIEKIAVGTDPITHENICAYRFWKKQGLPPDTIPVHVNARGMIFCSVTENLDSAKAESLGAKEGKEPLVIDLIDSVRVVSGPKEEETLCEASPPSIPRPRVESPTDNQLKSVQKERESFNERIFLQLKSFGDKPKYLKHTLSYTDSGGKTVSVERKTFSHPENSSVSVFGYPYIKEENGDFYLRYADSPSQRNLMRTPMSVFESVIRESIRNEENIRNEMARSAEERQYQARLLEKATEDAREHAQKKAVFLSFEDVASLLKVPTNNKQISFTIGQDVYSVVPLQIGQYSFLQTPYLHVERNESGPYTLEVRYSVDETLPEIDESAVLKAIQDAREHLHMVKSEKILSLLKEEGEPVSVSLLHISHQPKIDPNTSEVVVILPNQKQEKYPPREFSHEGITILGYPFIEYEGEVFSLKYAHTQAVASEKMLSQSDYERLVRDAALEEVCKEKQYIVPSDIVLSLTGVFRQADGSLSSGDFKPHNVQRRGFLLTIYPSLKFNADENLICTYSAKDKVMSDEEISHEVDLALSSISNIQERDMRMFSKEITLDLSHLEKHRTINEQGVLTYFDSSGKEMKVEPHTLIIHEKSVMAFPYIFAGDRKIEVRYKLTLTEAHKAHIQTSHYSNLIRNAILKELPKEFFERAVLIDHLEVEQMVFPERLEDGSLRIGRRKQIETRLIDERGVQIILYPSIILKQDRADDSFRLGIVYTPKGGKKELTREKFDKALRASKDKVAETRLEEDGSLVFTPVKAQIKEKTEETGTSSRSTSIKPLPCPNLEKLFFGKYQDDILKLVDLSTFSSQTKTTEEIQAFLIELLHPESTLFQFYKASFEFPRQALHTLGTEDRFIHTLDATSSWKNVQQLVRAYCAQAFVSYGEKCLGYKPLVSSVDVLEQKSKITQDLSENFDTEIRMFFSKVVDLLVNIRNSKSQ